MEAGFARIDEGRYRWRGDGLVPEWGPLDYLHGASRSLNGPGLEAELVEEGRRSSVDSRLLHWDRFVPEDDRSRTA
jgi:hypothetical protein